MSKGWYHGIVTGGHQVDLVRTSGSERKGNFNGSLSLDLGLMPVMISGMVGAVGYQKGRR